MSPSKSSKRRSSGTGVLDYLRRKISRDKLVELYLEPDRGRFVCRAILQQLSSVAQQVVVRLVCAGGEFPVAGVQVWTNLRRTAQMEMLDELYEWAILAKQTDETSLVVTMTEQFQLGMKAALLHMDASPWTPLSPAELHALRQQPSTSETKSEGIFEEVTPESLERHMQTQWDLVLHFLVGSVGHQEPSSAVVHFLLETGLMQPDPEDKVSSPEDAALVITQAGYDFMLQDNHQQVWHFVLQYLKSIESHRKKGELRHREALLLLICLSFARVGEAYLANSLSKESSKMVKDLALFGLLYTENVGDGAECKTFFYPTQVAVQLVGNDSNTDGTTSSSAMWSLSSKALDEALAHPRPRDSSHLAIICQTNFQVCAYTTSELHVSMLGLFCDVQSIRRLPNVVFLYITRESVKTAFALGIQARQILRFLEKHAHPKLRTPSGSDFDVAHSPIPSNIVDQIWLWDRERTRVTLTEVYEHQCQMEGEFEAVVQYAKHHGAYAWSSDRRVFVNYAHAERARTFVSKWRAKSSARLQS
jgi:transcription initiation factor TFIIH subunit 4